MSRAIIILDSKQEGGQKFFSAVEENGYRTVIKDMCNFSQEQLLGFVEEFACMDNKDILILKGCSEKLSSMLQKEFAICFSILITDNDETVANNKKYCKAINYLNDNFISNIASTMRILTSDF